MRGFAPATAADRRFLDDGSQARAMSWVMAVMLFLTVLAGALGLGTARAAAGLDRELAGRLTVQWVGADPAGIARLVTALRGLPGVAAVRDVPRAELAELLKPWLGDAGLGDDLPMPALIDVTVAGASPEAVAALVAGVAPGAQVDRSARWLAPVRSVIVALTWLAIALVLLMAGATAAIVLLAARAGLDTHRDTIDVLHMLGSTDVQVARLFQRRIGLDTLLGGAIGGGLALATVALIGARIGALEAAALKGSTLGLADWLVLAGMPFAFALLAVVAARIAVLRTLRRVM